MGTVQVDLDGAWTWMQLLGHESALDPDPLFERALPTFLRLFAEEGIRATLFVSGADLTSAAKRRLLEQALADGHELACHGYHHRYLTLLDPEEQDQEIAGGARVLGAFAGRRPRGFRAPGFALNGRALQRVVAEGYLYDSSVFPTIAGPALSLYLRGLTRSGLTYRPRFFPRAPLRPYRPSPEAPGRPGQAPLLEIPVTTVPILRIPLHFSYAVRLGRRYFDAALALLRAFRLPVNYVFHLVDLMDRVEGSPLADVGLLRIPLGTRLALARHILRRLTQGMALMPTEALCSMLQQEHVAP